MEYDGAVERTSPPANCFWCERLHPGEHALSICPECTARYPTAFGGRRGLDNEREPSFAI
jgi:hypothetical protein